MLPKLKAICWLVIFALIVIIVCLLLIVIMLAAVVCAIFASNGLVKQWGVNCWEGLDNFLSAVIGGDPDESVSSRLGKARKAGSSWSFVTDRVDLVAKELFNDDNHCDRSIERDEGRKQVTKH